MSYAYFSDLTDLSSSDEDDVPLAKRTSKSKKAPKEYKITNVLRAPRTAQYTARSLYDQIIENAIDLDPEYQRDVIWQEEKQSGLIDSILRNYYIPPIIFAVTIQDDGSELRTCIDGKQRLTSIQRFIDGQIPHKDSFTNERLWFKSTATGTRRKLLPQQLRTQFANKQIVCVEYTELNGDQEREIFQRVQLGVALTPAERLQALVGPWSTVIREIQNQVLGEEGFEGYLDWGHARGRDFQCLATIGYLIENHPKTAIPGPKTLEKWLQRPQPVSAQLRIDLHETFRIFVTLARDKKYSGSLNRPTRVSPIEFVMIGVLIYLKRQSLSLTQISSAVEKMRKDVRASHQDIRSNTRVTKHLMEFMAKKIKVSELRSDGEGDIPAAEAIAKVVKPTKRKRPIDPDDTDMEPSSEAKLTKLSTRPVSSQGINLPKQIPVHDQKTTSTRESVTALNRNSSLLSKPSKPPTQRTTNNSLSSFSFASAPKPSLPLLPARSSGNQSNLPLSSTLDSPINSGPTISSTAGRAPLTIQTGQVESPQMSSLNSPITLSGLDRLAPIRAAKASLASGQASQSPVDKSNELGTALKNGPRIPVGPRQNPAAPPHAVHQTTVVHPQLPPPTAVPPNPPGVNTQGRHVPPQFEEALRNLRSQYPQLGASSQSVDNGVANPSTYGQSSGGTGTGAHSMMPPPVPGAAKGGDGSHLDPRRNGVGTQGSHTENNTRPQSNPNRPHEASTVPSWPSNQNMSGHVAPRYQQFSNHSAPTSAGMRDLPPRAPTSGNYSGQSMRPEPFGPHRSAPFEGGILEGRRGTNSYDRHRPRDDRRFSRYDRSYSYDRYHDHNRDKQSWSRSRS